MIKMKVVFDFKQSEGRISFADGMGDVIVHDEDVEWMDKTYSTMLKMAVPLGAEIESTHIGQSGEFISMTTYQLICENYQHYEEQKEPST